MTLVRCDINTCKKEMAPEQSKKTRLLEKEYDLCEECFKSLVAFIQVRLLGGRDLSKDKQPADGQLPIINWPLPTQQPFINIPNITYPMTSGGTVIATPGVGTTWTISNSSNDGQTPVKTFAPFDQLMEIPTDDLLAQMQEMLNIIDSTNNPPPSTNEA